MYLLSMYYVLYPLEQNTDSMLNKRWEGQEMFLRAKKASGVFETVFTKWQDNYFRYDLLFISYCWDFKLMGIKQELKVFSSSDFYFIYKQLTVPLRSSQSGPSLWEIQKRN